MYKLANNLQHKNILKTSFFAAFVCLDKNSHSYTFNKSKRKYLLKFNNSTKVSYQQGKLKESSELQNSEQKEEHNRHETSIVDWANLCAVAN